MDTKVIILFPRLVCITSQISRRSELLFVFDRSARRGRSPCIAYFLCKSNVELIHISERSTASRTRVLQDVRKPLAVEKRAWLYSTARQKAALNRTDNIAKLYCGSAEASLIREACQIGMLRGGALSMFVDAITSCFRRPGHVSPPQICKARMAAGESADITTATDSKGEGRFIEGLRSVSVRTQRPNPNNAAPAEKFHGVSRSLDVMFTRATSS